MAGNSKFGRHAKRSPAAARYRAESRSNVNKIKKMRKHVKAHPQDKANASWLDVLKNGGEIRVNYPVLERPQVDFKRDARMEQPTDFDWSKMQVLYFVRAMPEGVVLCHTPFFSEALKAFVKTKTRSIIEERSKGRFKTIRSQGPK